MSGALNEAVEIEPVAPPTERSTGLVFAGAALIGAILLRNSTMSLLPAALATASAGFAVVSLAAPSRLRLLNMAWFKLALLMNRVVSPIVMLALYVTTIVPFGLAMQLRRDPLRKSRQAAPRTYWISRSGEIAPGSMRNQF